MIKDIYNRAVEVMTQLKGTGQPLAEVYGYPEGSPQLFPCAIMDIEGGMTQEDTSSMSKWLSAKIIIRVLIRQKNAEVATIQRLEIMDAVLAKFTTTQYIDDLGGVCDLLDISAIEPMFISGTSEQPLFGFDIILTAKKVMRAS